MKRLWHLQLISITFDFISSYPLYIVGMCEYLCTCNVLLVYEHYHVTGYAHQQHQPTQASQFAAPK